MKMPSRFIVVDDDPTSNLLCRFAIRRFFEETEIQLFTEPEDALEVIKKDYSRPGEDMPTILFLDINMPSMTGWDFLNVFKDFSPHIQKQFNIYILSSSVDHRDKEKAEVNPLISGFLSKPLSKDVIMQIFLENEKQV